MADENTQETVNNQAANSEDAVQPTLQIQRIYVKDVSLKHRIYRPFFNKSGNRN